MIRGAWKNTEPKTSKLVMMDGFRLIRTLSDEHNMQRLRTHVDQLGRTVRLDRKFRKCRLRTRRLHRKEKALYLAQQPDTGRGDGNHLPQA